MHSIRIRITAITIAAILTSILSVIGTSYFTIKAENDRSSGEIMNLLNVNVRQSLDDYLESIQQSAEMAANIASDTLDDVALVEGGAAGRSARHKGRTQEQIERLDAYLVEYCAQLQEAFSSIASQTNGVVAYYYCINPEISHTQHGFFFAKAGKTGFVKQPPLDAAALDPEDMEHNVWFYAAIQRGRPSWVGPYPDRYLAETQVCSFTVPIYKAGVLIGVLGMDMPFETLASLVREIHFYETGFACLFGDDNRVLYHPEYSFGDLPDRLDPALLEEIFSQNNNGGKLVRYATDGQERQMAFSTLSNGMKLVIIAPRREIIAPWMRLTRRVLLITAGVIFAFSLIVLFVMGIITRPLKRLTAASKRLADEDYDVALDYGGRDEVGTLTRAFMQMRNHVKSYVDDLNRRIYTDALTGIPNMRYFFKLAERERVRMMEEGQCPVLLYFNLVGMKFYNRQYGFDEGDRLILDIAAILTRHYGEQRVSRVGQDHFAAVTDEDTVEEELHVIFQECLGANGGRSLPVIVGIYPDSLGEVDASTALDRAKFAVDRLKGTYVSGYRFFDAAMLKRVLDNNYIINHIDQAIAEGWIKVYYQPIVRAANGRVCDEEALARWIDPERGMISPGEFIPALEESKLIYKLDLYMAEQILQKMKRMAEAGLYVVPQSVNLSRVDFEVCDIVEEIRRRVDDAGVPRDMLTIEVTESVIGGDFDMMKAQIERFQSLGFKVWMDDFGSGYSSLDVLQSIHFDLIKLDMRFMTQFDNGDKSKIIITELVKMAIGLGIETVCEGVERQEQVDFLREVGCTKLQGFYYCRPIPPEEIVERNRRGIQIGYENPDESGYYESLGRVNLYDLGTFANADSQDYSHYFDTLPMAVLESDAAGTTIVRCNKSYREFMMRTFGIIRIGEPLPYSQLEAGPVTTFIDSVRHCGPDRPLVFVNEEMNSGSTVHAIIRHIAVNPVKGINASAVAVLGISDESDRGITYTHIAQALSADYINLYYVNLDTEQFSEYSPDPAHAGLVVERRGENFFAQSRRDAEGAIYEGDLETFSKAFTKENVADTIDRDGAFTLTYRLMVDGEQRYVNMKAVRMKASDRHLIIGVNNVDAQMKQREALDRLREEQITYTRIAALYGDLIVIYTVDPATDHYIEYSATRDYEGLGLAKRGEDFFAAAHADCLRTVCKADVEKFLSAFTKENVLRSIREDGVFALQYRIIIEGELRYVSLKAAQVEEKNGPRIIVGVNDIDAQVRRELEYAHNLSVARNKANIDVLTGVKNRAAFDSEIEHLDAQAAEHPSLEYAVAAFEVTGVEAVRAEHGPEAADVWIRRACSAICVVFKHSPVFRVGEASFVAICRGSDYSRLDALTDSLEAQNRKNAAVGDVVIACGAARHEGDAGVEAVLQRAEAGMRRSRAALEK